MSGEEEIIEVTIDMAELKKMKVPELKRKVAELGLSTKGTKAELLDRVEKYIHEQEEELLEGEGEENVAGEEGDEAEEDAGEGDEGEEEVGEEDAGEGDEGEEEVNKDNEATATSVASLAAAEEEAKPEAQQQATEAEVEKKSEGVAVPVKVSSVSGSNQADRLSQRAARFGGNCSEEVKKIARAERFGTALENGYLGLGKRGAPNEAELEKMKKRAERFGSSVSPVIVGVEDTDKKQKRLQRFGQSVTELSVEERKKARAAKFGST